MGFVLGNFAADFGINDQSIGFEDVMSVVGTFILQSFGCLPVINNDPGFLNSEFGAFDEIGKISFPEGSIFQFIRLRPW